MKMKSTNLGQINNLLIAIKIAQLKGNKIEAKRLDKKLFKIQQKIIKENEK